MVTTRSPGPLLFCMVGLTMGGSLYEELEITTLKSLYSLGTSMLHHQHKGEVFTYIGPTFYRHKGNYYCSQHPDKETVCYCDNNYVGTPPRCRPTPEYWDQCIKDNPCGVQSECEITDGTRQCTCVVGYEGTPPNCRPGPEYRYCETADRCGPNSECDPAERQCHCLPGFLGNPPNCTAGTELLALCNPYPCGGFANCHATQEGAPVCSCSPGYLGVPPDCAPGPALWRVCFKDAPCGKHSHCTIQDQVAVCSPCAEGYNDEPPFCTWPLPSSLTV